jgi:hypothetical protein
MGGQKLSRYFSSFGFIMNGCVNVVPDCLAPIEFVLSRVHFLFPFMFTINLLNYSVAIALTRIPGDALEG